MSIIPQNESQYTANSAINRFFSDFSVGKLLRKCNASKEKGVPVVNVFLYKVKLCFSDRSMYMQQRTGTFREAFSKNTFYRFQNSVKTNWTRFTSLLAAAVIHTAVKPLTDDSRKNVFIIDDSLYRRTGYKHTELASKVFDHTDGKYKKGFRMLTLGWSDGNTFIPVNHCLLASARSENILGPVSSPDGRSIAARRRRLAQTKAPSAMLVLLEQAESAGIKADYVLFDTWFSNPAQIIDIKRRDMDVIAMVKNSSRIHYVYEGSRLSSRQIYKKNKKRRGRSRYLLSVEVDVEKDGSSIPARLVYIRNRNNRKEWIALICTDMTLSENEIIRIYGRRWEIEVFFKTCKSMLMLNNECHSLSYDALTAHVSAVFVRYMIIALEQRRNEDQRTLGELFFLIVDELADITFARSLSIIVDAMFASLQATLRLTDEQIDAFFADFEARLPEHIRNALNQKCLA